ncbi:hypothetical protein GQ607_000603 [Colletotrichum asianum]|uniref:Uncharacterized protein n=1 Tax=Colletotrichum asianum TaxID=702518 RepID=A0A8H3ZXV3_9PEZI|nr:hypothetical protein GQ607_000603 [Colletotrichum asianum]
MFVFCPENHLPTSAHPRPLASIGSRLALSPSLAVSPIYLVPSPAHTTEAMRGTKYPRLAPTVALHTTRCKRNSWSPSSPG